MPQLENIVRLISELDPVEREELLFVLAEKDASQRFATPEYPSVVATPGVCGGVARLIRTRVPVWVLERMRQLGISEIDILRSYPSLRAADLVQAWSYAASHRAEIDTEIRENEEA